MTRKTFVFELQSNDIGKDISFNYLLGKTAIEVKGKLGGIDGREITVKEAFCRILPNGDWAPSQEKNPAFPVQTDTPITVIEKD